MRAKATGTVKRLPHSTGVPRRRLTAERRRRQLIDVALESFATNGFNETTMEDIATAAGVTKPLLYQHFESKRALYLELIDDVAARLIGALAAATTVESRTRRRVELGFEAYFRFTIENQSAVRMLFDAPHDGSSQEDYGRSRTRLLSFSNRCSTPTSKPITAGRWRLQSSG